MPNQDTLNSAVQVLTDALTRVEAELAAARAESALDFTGLDGVVTRARGLVPDLTPAPADTTPPPTVA